MDASVDWKRHPVLYVDDDRANVFVFRSTFREDFTVLTAESGEEALEVLASRQVAVLVTDQRMPGMSGLALAEQVRLRYPEVVRMLVTAFAEPESTTGAVESGRISRFILKPWRPDEVEAHLKEAILAHRTHQGAGASCSGS